MSGFLFRRQPLKGLYKVYFLSTTLFIRVPFWLITSAPPFLRPRRTWSFKRSVVLKLMRAFVGTFFATHMPAFPGADPYAVVAAGEAEVDKVGFMWVDAIEDSKVVGEVKEIAALNGAAPKKMFGYWFKQEGYEGKADAPAGPDEKVVLHFHGGGYIMGSSHPLGGATGHICGGLLKNYSKLKRTFAGGYRLASSAPFKPESAFPTALFDALASYAYLVRVVGFKPENVIVSGDSAGGHLALTLARYLALNNFADLPKPGAAVLMSPTVEWAVTHSDKGGSWERNASTDYSMDFFYTGYSKRSILGKLPEESAVTNAWISPASRKLAHTEGLFAGFPKTYLLVGDAEVALDSTHTVRDRMVADMGAANVLYDEVKDSTHDFLAMRWHEPERTDTFKRIGVWIDSL